MRVLLFTGKGGVGKTTTAAATALRLADEGHRVIITSADPAHSLADAFDIELGPRPTPVIPRCDAQQLDARQQLEASWVEIRRWLMDVFRWAGMGAVEAEELSVLPGLDELFTLVELDSLCSSGEYDVVVVDCAPTAETLRLLSLPEALGWYRSRALPVSRRVSRLVGPVVSRLTSMPVAGDEVFTAGEMFLQRLEAARLILSDPEVTSARLVVNPEQMVLAEARRTFSYLSLYGYQVDAVVVNRILPDTVEDPWFAGWRQRQAEHLDSIVSDFAPIPVLRADLAPSEIVGVEPIRLLGKELWSNVDPSARLVDGRPMSVEVEGDSLVLSLDLPLVDRGAVDVARTGDEVIVTLGPHRRCIALPDSMRRREVGTARMDAGRLRISFVERS